MKESLSRTKRITIAALSVTAASVFVAFLYYVFYIKGNGLICITYELTGFYCPGCGMGRASLCLLHGDFIGAVKNNPFIFLLILVLIYILSRLADWAITGKNHIDKHIPPKALMSILIVLMIFGVLRNIPIFPFTALTPN